MICNGFENNRYLIEGRNIFLVCRGSFDMLPFANHIISMNPVRFGDFTPNPKMEEVLRGVQSFLSSNCDSILAVGGGSSIDVAKCIKYYSKSEVPIFAIPTTAGTGSESTHFAVVYKDGNKLSIADKTLLPEIAILEPSALKNVPEYTRKATMLDALCHAIESHWAMKATPSSKMLSEKAIMLILEGMNSYLANEDKGNSIMLEAANIAGQAINITTTTAAHAMSYKITSMYGLQHGHAVAICLPEVWRYIDDAPGITRNEFLALLNALGIRRPTSNHYEEDIETLTHSVNAQRLANSPVSFGEEQLAEMYQNIILNQGVGK